MSFIAHCFNIDPAAEGSYSLHHWIQWIWSQSEQTQPQLRSWKLLNDVLSECLTQHQYTNTPSILGVMTPLTCVQIPFSSTRHLRFKVWVILSYVRKRAVAVRKSSIARSKYYLIPASLIVNLRYMNNVGRRQEN